MILQYVAGFLRSHATEIRIFLTVWIVYLFHLGPLPEANENRYLDLVMSVVDEGRFEIDTNHHNTIDKSYFDDHYYAGAAPGPSILAVPAYALLKLGLGDRPLRLFRQYDVESYIRGYLKAGDAPADFISNYPFGKFIIVHMFLTAVVVSILTALTAVLLFCGAGEIGADRRTAIMIALVFAFGTITFFHGTRFYSHNISVFFLVMGFLISKPWQEGTASKAVIFTAGLMVSLSVAMDFNTGPVAGLLAVFMFIRCPRNRIPHLIVGLGLPALAVAWYQYVCFGNPFTTPYGLPSHADGLGVHADQVQGYYGFVLPPLSRVWALTFGSYRGLFVYSPVLLPAVYGICVHFWRSRQDVGYAWSYIMTVCLLQFAVVCTMGYWYAGWGFGPRYLIPLLPFALMGLATSDGMRWPKLTYILAGASVLINWCGVQYGPSDSAFGVVGQFVLSGLTTPLHSFVDSYFKTYTALNVDVSALGVWLFLSLSLYAIWRRSSSEGVILNREGRS